MKPLYLTRDTFSSDYKPVTDGFLLHVSYSVDYLVTPTFTGDKGETKMNRTVKMEKIQNNNSHVPKFNLGHLFYTIAYASVS